MKYAVIDIDGVLNYYPDTFVNFYNDYQRTNSRTTQPTIYKTMSEIKNNTSYNEYNRLKTLYRKSDYKHEAKVRDDAVSLFTFLHEHNYLIYIVTSRELFKYNQLEKTILWLQKNNLKYDYLYCSQKKDYTIFEKFKHVDLVVEDSLDNLEKIKRINGEALYFNIINSENELLESEEDIFRVNTLREVEWILNQREGEKTND